MKARLVIEIHEDDHVKIKIMLFLPLSVRREAGDTHPVLFGVFCLWRL